MKSFLDNIMTAKEYSQTKHKTPYIFVLKKKNGKELYYFGSLHTRDPKNPLFENIEVAFKKADPDIIFAEGMHVQGDVNRFNEMMKGNSREDVVDRMGEAGFIVKLALEKGIAWYSPKTADEDLYSELLAQRFSKEEVFAWEVLQILPQYNRQMNKHGFAAYAEPHINALRQATSWDGFDYSYEHAIRIGEKILGKVLEVENEPHALDFIDPIPWAGKQATQTTLNRLSEASSIMRDRKIVSEIAETFKTYKKIFVVYGSSHAVMQEPALRRLFKSF